MSEIERIRATVNEDSRSLREIAEAAGVGYSWLRMFARNEIPDPSYQRIRLLQDWAAGIERPTRRRTRPIRPTT